MRLWQIEQVRASKPDKFGNIGNWVRMLYPEMGRVDKEQLLHENYLHMTKCYASSRRRSLVYHNRTAILEYYLLV